MAQALYKMYYSGPKVQKKMDFPIECLFAPNKDDTKDPRPHALVTYEHGQQLVGRFPDAFEWAGGTPKTASTGGGAGSGPALDGDAKEALVKLAQGFDNLVEQFADLKYRITSLEDKIETMEDDLYTKEEDDGGDDDAPKPGKGKAKKE